MAANWNTLLNEKQNRSGENKTEARDVLVRFMNCYDASNDLRNNYYRCIRFVDGDQWGDTVRYMGQDKTEAEVLEMQGKYAVVNNFLRILVRNYVGLYVKQDIEATCSARGGANQKLADIMSMAVQYNWDINSQKELNATIFENGLQAPCFVGKVSIGINEEGVYDVWTEYVDFANLIVDPNMKDPRGTDLTIIGEIHDMPITAVLSKFAKSKADRDRIAAIYKECDRKQDLLNTYKQLGRLDTNCRNFLFPEFGMCRVYEIWTKEHRDGYFAHDFLNGECCTISEEEKAEIDEENNARIGMARSVGVAEADIQLAIKIANGDKSVEGMQMPDGCKLIKCVYFYEDYWYCRYLAPNGVVIWEGESIYEHKSHPYVLRFYPMVAGNARSFIEDVIDLQKDINRMDTMYDWIMRHSAKGALLMPSDQMDIESGWNLKKYGQEWSKPDAVIPYKAKAGFPKPEQISSNNTNIGLVERIREKQQWIQDITGVQGTLQGKSSFAGQAASMYAQQTENATTSLIPLTMKFGAWTIDLVRKQIKCMQQCYSVEKFLDICAEAGFDATDVKNIKDIKTIDIKVKVNESPSSAVYRASINQKLDLFLQLGLIDRDIYLNNTTLPFDWKLRRDIEKQAQAAQQGQQEPLPTRVPQNGGSVGVEGGDAATAGANNAHNQMKMGVV